MSLSNISIVGNLVRPPEQMCFSSGNIKTTLVVAVNGKQKTGKPQPNADFYRVETWGKLAELSGKYLAKGNQVAVSGRLVMDYWTDRHGKERVTPIVEASQVSFPPKLKVVEKGGEENVDLPNPIGGEILVNEDDALLGLSEEEDSFMEELAEEKPIPKKKVQTA